VEVEWSIGVHLRWIERLDAGHAKESSGVPTATIPTAIANLTRSLVKATRTLNPAQLRRLLARPEPLLTSAMVAFSLGVGAVWVLALNSPGI